MECIARARDNAHTMRHQVATEMWEALNRFHLDVQRTGRRRRGGGRREHHALLPLDRRFQPAAPGITDSTMPREEGLVLPPGRQVPGAGGVDGAHDRRELPAPRRLERRERRSPCPGRRGATRGRGERCCARSPRTVVPPHPEQGHPADRGDRVAHPLRSPASFDPVLDREGRRCPRPHQRAGPRLQRLRADAGRSTESEARREVGRLHAGSPTSGSTTCSIRACTHPCSTSNAAAIASATASRTSSSPTGL